MQPTHSLTVISLGGGVQSSVMALMASQGAFDAIPDCAIFPDTHWEPPSLYTHLDWLAERLGFPMYVVDNGRSQCTEHYKIRRAPRSAWVERSGCGTRPGVGRWLGEQAWGPEAEPCLKPPRQCGDGDPAKPCAASQSVVMVTKGTAD